LSVVTAQLLPDRAARRSLGSQRLGGAHAGDPAGRPRREQIRDEERRRPDHEQRKQRKRR
jgi:hypothetical protein